MNSFHKTLIVVVLIFCGTNHLISQQKTANVRTTINETVWQVFKTAYEARDAELFKSIHSPDALRINDSGIKTSEDYFNDIDNWNSQPPRGTLKIDFAFESRFHDGSIAYETGYYRVIYEFDKKANISYGMFHVVLRKVEGKWLIFQDFDTSKVGSVTIDETFFNAASLLELK